MKTKSQIFDFGRFLNCIKRDLTLNGRSWLLKAFMMLGVTTILLLFATMPGRMELIDPANYSWGQYGRAFTAFRFCGTVFCALGASLFMENMTSNGLRLNTLMSPASTLEKFLSRWVICVLGTTIAFLICFALAGLIRVAIFSWYYDLPSLRYLGPIDMMKLAEHWYYFWGSIATVQAVFLLGSTVAPKNAFLKTFGALVILVLAWGFAVGNTYAALLPEGYRFHPENPDELFDTIARIMPVIWVTFCYITAYFRMKESEIINRL